MAEPKKGTEHVSRNVKTIHNELAKALNNIDEKSVNRLAVAIEQLTRTMEKHNKLDERRLMLEKRKFLFEVAQTQVRS